MVQERYCYQNNLIEHLITHCQNFLIFGKLWWVGQNFVWHYLLQHAVAPLCVCNRWTAGHFIIAQISKVKQKWAEKRSFEKNWGIVVLYLVCWQWFPCSLLFSTFCQASTVKWWSANRKFHNSYSNNKTRHRFSLH